MTCSVLLLFPVSVMLIGDTLSLRTLGLAFRVAWGFADPARLSREPSPVDPGSLPLEPADPSALVHMASLLEWLVPATVGLGLVALRLGRRIGASTFVACALVLVAVDLFKADMGWNPAVPIAHATQPTTPAIRYLQARRPARFVAVKQPGFSPVPPFPPNVAMRYGLYDARGYDYPVERRYYELWHRYVSESPTCFFADCGGSVDVRREALHALGLLGVRYILQDSSAPPLAVSGLRLAYNGGDARIYSNSYALPRAFVVDREQLVADEAAARAKVGSPAFAGQSSVVTERHLDGLASGRRRGLPGRASIDTYAADRVVARTSASHRALLVLTDVWYPGWKAKVDGRTTPVRRVDYLLRGVTIPAGTHRVELTYEPPSWRAGWVVSLVALIAMVTIVLTGRRRPRREQRAA